MKEYTERDALSELMAMCAKAEHCEYEMQEKMRRWGIPDDAQARIMARLVADKFVDDERYAEAFVRDKLRFNKWGRRKIDQALWAKRISEDIRQRALDSIADKEYIEILRPLLKQKSRSIRANSDYEARMKLTKFALSRGFDYDIIEQCMEKSYAFWGEKHNFSEHLPLHSIYRDYEAPF